MDVSSFSYDAIASRLELNTDMGEFTAGTKGVAGILRILPPNDQWNASNEEVANSIEEVSGCSCTDFKINTDGISFSYHDDTNLNGAESAPVTKSLVAYFLDGRPMKVRDHKGNLVINPSKMQLGLSYKGIAVKPKQ